MPNTKDYIWTGKPTEKDFPEYMFWRFFEVQRQLCDLWDVSHSAIIEFTPSYWQKWEYEPERLPKMTILNPTDPEQMT